MRVGIEIEAETKNNWEDLPLPPSGYYEKPDYSLVTGNEYVLDPPRDHSSALTLTLPFLKDLYGSEHIDQESLRTSIHIHLDYDRELYFNLNFMVDHLLSSVEKLTGVNRGTCNFSHPWYYLSGRPKSKAIHKTNFGTIEIRCYPGRYDPKSFERYINLLLAYRAATIKVGKITLETVDDFLAEVNLRVPKGLEATRENIGEFSHFLFLKNSEGTL